jgi:hypothetical protein
MKNNKYVIIAAGGVLLLFLILLASVAINLSTSPQKTNKSITPTPQANPGETTFPTPNIQVIATIPENNTSNIPLNTTITLTFNQAITPDEVTVTASPDISFTTTVNNNTLTLIPATAYQPATIYNITIKYSPSLPAYIYSFRTIGAPKDTFDFPDQRADKSDIINAPDVFLARRTPHQEAEFYVSSSVSNQTGDMTFIVTLNGTDKASSQQKFLEWVKSQGLTDSQIKSLSITYQ